ncbi:MAG TPA: hypothetical protein ENF69_01330 [Euryarchaeota archaeon]|nr:hypothetical protein [Euryarchaeota archaeon]
MVRAEECSASADLPVTIYTKPTLPKGSSAQGGMHTIHRGQEAVFASMRNISTNPSLNVSKLN